MVNVYRRLLFLLSGLLLCCAAIMTVLAINESSSNPVTVGSRQDEIKIRILSKLEDLALEPAVHDIVLEIQNLGQQTVRVAGISSGCFNHCCFREKEPPRTPCAVYPGQSMKIVIEMKVSSVSSFTAPLTVYLDQEGLRNVDIQLNGTGK